MHLYKMVDLGHLYGWGEYWQSSGQKEAQKFFI